MSFITFVLYQVVHMYFNFRCIALLIRVSFCIVSDKQNLAKFSHYSFIELMLHENMHTNLGLSNISWHKPTLDILDLENQDWKGKLFFDLPINSKK